MLGVRQKRSWEALYCVRDACRKRSGTTNKDISHSTLGHLRCSLSWSCIVERHCEKKAYSAHHLRLYMALFTTYQVCQGLFLCGSAPIHQDDNKRREINLERTIASRIQQLLFFPPFSWACLLAFLFVSSLEKKWGRKKKKKRRKKMKRKSKNEYHARRAWAGRHRTLISKA